MQWLRSVSVRHRLQALAVLVSVVLLALGGSGWWLAQRTTAHTQALFDQANQFHAEISLQREGLADLRYQEAAMVAVSISNPTDVEGYLKAWQQQVQALRDGGQRLVALQSGAGNMAELVAAQAKLLDEYHGRIEPVATQLMAARLDASAGLAYMQQAHELVEQMSTNSQAMQKALDAGLAELRDRFATQVATEARWRLGLVGLIVLVVLPVMGWTQRSISQPLEQATQVARAIASGNLASQIHDSGRDEPARLMAALAEMQSALAGLVGQVRDTAQHIDQASADVARGNAELQSRSEQAAAHLQHTVSAMQTLSHTVRDTAQHAGSAYQLASSTAAVAQRGGTVVGDVVGTMNDINDSSRRIADITGVIDGIAFQTNILALNAAVEAARAGEQGRGFAVVAGEVRALAQRSAHAAKEISGLINESLNRVHGGAQLGGTAGHTMDEILGSVQQVNQLIGDISNSAAEQDQGLGHINSAVNELAQMTQQNTHQVQHGAAAAEHLRQQSERLNQIVSAFVL